MPDFRIRVIVDPSGSKVGTQSVRNDLGRLETEAERTTANIKRAFIALGTAIAARGILDLSDSFTNIENRIKTVTSSTGELNERIDDLFGIANRTRVSIDSVAGAYARFRRATNELGLSQQEVLNFTESVNQAIILSGATGAEASAGLIQFAQGLSAGALRGDEFRSVSEQLTVILDVLQQQTGKTSGELKKMADSGQLTAKLIVNAFKGAATGLRDDFGGSTKTIGQTINVLRNNFVRFLGDLQKSTGIFSVAAGAFGLLADHISTFAKVVFVLALPSLIGLVGALKTFVGLRVAAVVALWTKAMAGLRVAALATTLAFSPIVATVGVVVVAIGALAAAVAFFWDEIVAATKAVGRFVVAIGEDTTKAAERALGEIIHFRGQLILLAENMLRIPNTSTAVTDAFGNINTALRGIGDTLDTGIRLGLFELKKMAERGKEAQEAFEELKSEFEALEQRVDPVVRRFAEWAEVIITLDRAVAAGIVTEERAEAIRSLYAQTTDGAAMAVKRLREEEERLRREREAAKRREDEAAERERRFGSQFFEPGGGAIENPESQQQARSIEEHVKGFEELIRRQNQLIDLAALSARERAIETELLRIQEEAIRRGIGYSETQLALIRSRIEARYEVIDAQEKEADRQRATIALAQQLSSTLVDAAFEGDQSFGEFMGNLLKDLAKAIAQALILKAILTAAGVPQTQQAGAFGPIGTLLGFARGGSFTVGGTGGTDSELVAFRATPGERVDVLTPAQQSRGPGGGPSSPPPVVNVAVVADMDGAFREFGTSDEFGQLVVVQLGRNQSRVKSILGGR